MDEPLPVEQPRRLLQQLNPPPVVFHQVVVGGQEVCNTELFRNVWNGEFEGQELGLAEVVLRCALSELLNSFLNRHIKQVFEKTGIGFVLVGDEADYAVWKAGIKCENCRVRNICRNRYAQRSRFPETTLSKSGLGVGLGCNYLHRDLRV